MLFPMEGVRTKLKSCPGFELEFLIHSHNDSYYAKQGGGGFKKKSEKKMEEKEEKKRHLSLDVFKVFLKFVYLSWVMSR